MSGAIGDKKRLIRVTEGNVRNNHLYISQHLDFFPSDILGPSSLSNGLNGHAVYIFLDGLNETIKTDIPTDSKTGRPRQMFRRRAWVRKFFTHHQIKSGDLVALQRISKRKYKLSTYQAKPGRCDSWREWIGTPLPGDAPTVIELFAGCGGMALGFKRAGFTTVLANEAFTINGIDSLHACD